MAEKHPDLIKCMSTNGLLLPKYADRLAELGVNSVTVTINAIDPDIAVDIYSFIKYEGKVYKDYEAVKILIKNQLDGVEKAAANGMVVKVNSVLIPGLNDEHIVEIAKEVKKRKLEFEILGCKYKNFCDGMTENGYEKGYLNIIKCLENRNTDKFDDIFMNNNEQV